MRGCLILLSLWVVACGPPGLMPCNTGGSGFGGGTGGFAGGDGARQVGLPGKQLKISLTIPRFVSCGPGSISDEVVTEVLDPSNRKVEHTHLGPTQISGGSAFATTLSFTPQTAGSYHLSARFEPSIGSVQVDVDVAIDRTSAPSRLLSLGTTCSALEVTDGGLVLCLAPGDSLKVFRDDLLLQSMDADDFAVAGAQVWTTRLGVVKRHSDLGGPMPLGVTLTRATLLTEVGTLLARETEALLVTPGGAIKLVVAAGALVEQSRLSYGVASPFTVLPREDLSEVVLVGSRQQCALRFAGAGATACGPSGVDFRGQLRGSDASGVWTWDTFNLVSTTFRGASLDGGFSATSLALPEQPVPFDVLPRHFQSTPVFAAGGFQLVPKVGPGGIVFEAYDVGPGFTLQPGSSTTVRAQHSDGRQKLFTP